MTSSKSSAASAAKKKELPKKGWDARGLEWIAAIRLAKDGDRRSIDWIYNSLVSMYSSITDDDDVKQELAAHFFRKVLPAFDCRYYPIPIIYKSAKRMTINIYKRNRKFSLEVPSGDSFVFDSVPDSSRCATEYIGIFDRIAAHPGSSEEIRVIAICRMCLPILKMIMPSLDRRHVIGKIQEATGCGSDV